jgi:hypothetical protein
MGQITLLSPTTADSAAVIADATRYKFVTVSADDLGTGESIPIQMIAGGVGITVADPATGTAIALTPSLPAVQLAGGAVYLLDKPETTGFCGIYMDTGPGINS